jgi:hypothetical protein
LNYKNKNWIQTLALETETAIVQLPPQEQECIRVRAAYNIKQLYKQQSAIKYQNSNQATKEYRTLNQIKEKLRSNKTIISKADKGNSIVILYTKDYHDKIQSFIESNNFTIPNKNPTITFQNKVKATIKNCHTTIPKDNNAKFNNLNPTAPNIRGLPKVHKEGCPIRPVINWQGAPAYKLAKYLNKLIHLYIPQPNALNITNSVHLIEDFLEIPYKQGIRLVSFDIENMYPIIPSKELIHIIEKMSKANQLDDKITKELVIITWTVIEQNYFTSQNKNYCKNTGLAMGAPSSAVLSEVYLQHLEHTEIQYARIF